MTGQPHLARLWDPGWTHRNLTGARDRVLDRFGLQIEERVLCALERCDDLIVCHSRQLDVVHKLDAVLLHRDEPGWPAVGLQLTLRHCPQKRAETLNVVAQTRVVTHFLYVEIDDHADAAMMRLLTTLVRLTAQQPPDRAAVFAAIGRDDAGAPYVHGTTCGPLALTACAA